MNTAIPIVFKQLRSATATMLLLSAALMFGSTAFAQQEAQACPAPPAAPTQEVIKELAKNAKDRGLLWKIEKDGRTSYLYGTIHINTLDWMMLGAKTATALRDSDVLAVEIDVLDPKVQGVMKDLSKLGIKNVELPEKQKLRIAAVAKKVCAPVEVLATMHPTLQFATLALLDARFSKLEMAYGSEVVLIQTAQALKKPVESLETAELQMRTLTSGEPEEIISNIESGLAAFERGSGRKIMERIHRLWGDSNLVEFEKYEEWCECLRTSAERKFENRINADRNLGMAASIDKLHRDGKKVFTAVGSLHMIGPKGIPALMKNMGYKVERVSFDAASK
jgi:uncharacterized protein